MYLTGKFKENIQEQHLFREKDVLLLAVSGGVDSVALCELCSQAGYSFVIAHCNFQLRGEESEADEQLVRSLAGKYGVPLHVRRFDTAGYALLHKLSVQVAARHLRYAWFEELLSEAPKWLLTGHHSGDNTETVLMNFFRGTGISGLRGIQPKQGSTIRPLLSFSKEEIIQFAREHTLQWREDSSNNSNKYSRNYFRNTIIPMVNKIFPEAEKNLASNIMRFREIETLYDQSIALHKKKLLEYKGIEIHIPILKLKKTVPLNTVVYEIVSPYNFSALQVKDVVHLLDGAHGKYIQSSTHRIIRNRNWLIIVPNETGESALITIDEGQTSVLFNSSFSIDISVSSEVNTTLAATPDTAYMDASEITYPLILRKWKQGDYFYPLGMLKKKKISRFLIDQKISPTKKEQIWVLESGKRICWIVGMRIDERFKVSDTAKKILTLRISC